MIVDTIWKLTNAVRVQSIRKNIREDLEDRWVTKLSEDRKRFYLVASQLDPRTKMLCSVTTSTSPHWKDDTPGFLSMDFKSFYIQHTQGEVNDEDGTDLDELLGIGTASMDFDPSSLEGEAQLQAYIQVQQVSNDTDPFSRVGLVQTDMRGRLVDTTMIYLKWAKQAP